MIRHTTAEEIFALLDGTEPDDARRLLDLLESVADGGFVAREDVARWAAILQVFAVDPSTVQ